MSLRGWVPNPGHLGPLLPALLRQVERNPFTLGDSSAPDRTQKLQEFIGKLQEVSALAVFCAEKCQNSCAAGVWGLGALGVGRSLTALFVQIIEGQRTAHFVMDDPAGNSYLQVQRCPEPSPPTLAV